MRLNLPQPIFTWLFVILSVVLFVFLALLVVLPALHEIQNTIYQTEFELALRGRDAIDSFLRQNIFILRDIASEDSMPAAKIAAEKHLQRSPEIKYFLISDSDARIIYDSSGEDSKKIQFPSATDISLIYKNGILISRAYLSDSGEPLVLISVPLKNNSGVLSAGLNLNFIWNFIQNLKF